MSRREVELPARAVEHMADQARQQLPAGLIENVADPGVYDADGASGPGWYHTSTTANEIFFGHEGEADFYVLDFAVSSDGDLASQGEDLLTTFEVENDGVVILGNIALAPQGTYSIVAAGTELVGKSDYQIDYTLALLDFSGGSASVAPIAEAGELTFSIFT